MWKITILAVMILCGWAISGCGASAIDTHLKAAQVTRSALDASKYLIEKAADDAAVAEMSNKNVDVQEAELNAHQALREFEKVRSLQIKAVSLYEIWVASLMSAYTKDENPSVLSVWYSLAMETYSTYKEMVIESIKLELDLPSIDSVIRKVIDQ